MKKILVLYGSTRRYGNSELLTEKIIEGIDCTKIYLLNKHIKPIEDLRHSPEGFHAVEDDYEEIIQTLLEHDILIFSTPLYWYGMSGIMKNFIDRWSQYLRDPRFDFKKELGKKQVYLVITGGDRPIIEAMPLVQQFTYIFEYMNIRFMDYIIGKGNKPGDILQDQSALSKAADLCKKLIHESAS